MSALLMEDCIIQHTDQVVVAPAHHKEVAARLLPEVNLSAMTITTSIPATSATVLQPNVLGIYRLLKLGVQKRLAQWATFKSPCVAS